MVTNNGPDVSDIEKRSGKKINKRYLKFTKERNRFQMGDNDVVLSRIDFPKYKAGVKGSKIDKPKHFKRSDRAKKIKKKIQEKRKNRLRVPPRK